MGDRNWFQSAAFFVSPPPRPHAQVLPRAVESSQNVRGRGIGDVEAVRGRKNRCESGPVQQVGGRFRRVSLSRNALACELEFSVRQPRRRGEDDVREQRDFHRGRGGRQAGLSTARALKAEQPGDKLLTAGFKGPARKFPSGLAPKKLRCGHLHSVTG